MNPFSIIRSPKRLIAAKEEALVNVNLKKSLQIQKSPIQQPPIRQQNVQPQKTISHIIENQPSQPQHIIQNIRPVSYTVRRSSNPQNIDVEESQVEPVPISNHEDTKNHFHQKKQQKAHEEHLENSKVQRTNLNETIPQHEIIELDRLSASEISNDGKKNSLSQRKITHPPHIYESQIGSVIKQQKKPQFLPSQIEKHDEPIEKKLVTVPQKLLVPIDFKEADLSESLHEIPKKSYKRVLESPKENIYKPKFQSILIGQQNQYHEDVLAGKNYKRRIFPTFPEDKEIARVNLDQEKEEVHEIVGSANAYQGKVVPLYRQESVKLSQQSQQIRQNNSLRPRYKRMIESSSKQIQAVNLAQTHQQYSNLDEKIKKNSSKRIFQPKQFSATNVIIPSSSEENFEVPQNRYLRKVGGAPCPAPSSIKLQQEHQILNKQNSNSKIYRRNLDYNKTVQIPLEQQSHYLSEDNDHDRNLYSNVENLNIYSRNNDEEDPHEKDRSRPTPVQSVYLKHQFEEPQIVHHQVQESKVLSHHEQEPQITPLPMYQSIQLLQSEEHRKIPQKIQKQPVNENKIGSSIVSSKIQFLEKGVQVPEDSYNFEQKFEDSSVYPKENLQLNHSQKKESKFQVPEEQEQEQSVQQEPHHEEYVEIKSQKSKQQLLPPLEPSQSHPHQSFLIESNEQFYDDSHKNNNKKRILQAQKKPVNSVHLDQEEEYVDPFKSSNSRVRSLEAIPKVKQVQLDQSHNESQQIQNERIASKKRRNLFVREGEFDKHLSKLESTQIQQ